MPNPEPVTISPLAAIRDKERALAQGIRSAEERATAIVAEARAHAESLKETAEHQGLADAEALFERGLAQARQEADALSQQGEADAAQQREAGQAHIDQAVNYIVNFVLPHRT